MSDFPPPLGGYEVPAPQPKDDHMADGSDASDGEAYELDKAGRRHPVDKYGYRIRKTGRPPYIPPQWWNDMSYTKRLAATLE